MGEVTVMCRLSKKNEKGFKLMTWQKKACLKIRKGSISLLAFCNNLFGLDIHSMSRLGIFVSLPVILNGIKKIRYCFRSRPISLILFRRIIISITSLPTRHTFDNTHRKAVYNIKFLTHINEDSLNNML